MDADTVEGRYCLVLRPAPVVTEDVLEAFLARVTGEDAAEPAAAWGEKAGFSLYDEEEVLGAYDASKRVDVDALLQQDEWLPWGLGIEEAYGDLGWRDQGDDGASDDDYFGEGADSLYSEDGDSLYWIDDYGAAMWDEVCEAAGDDVPRAVRLIRPLCWIGPLDQDQPEECPICLEELARGQQSWRLPCLHVFHEACMMHCFKRRRTRIECPLCRADIKRVACASLEESGVATAAIAAVNI